MDLEKIVCNCMGVTAAQIKQAVDAGAGTLAEVQEATGRYGLRRLSGGGGIPHQSF